MLMPRCKDCDWEYTIIAGRVNGKPHFLCLKCCCYFTERDDSTKENLLLRDTDYDDIWKFDDKRDLVHALCGISIYKKCNYGSELEKLTFAEKAIFVCISLENSVNNGGFAALVYNYCDILIRDVVNSFIEVGAHKTAEIYKRLLAACELPKDHDARNAWILDMPDGISAIMEESDNDFYKQPDDLSELYYQYIVQNKTQFTCD